MPNIEQKDLDALNGLANIGFRIKCELGLYELEDELRQLRSAVLGIAPWLSASLSSKELGGLGSVACAEYREACEAVFECDTTELMNGTR